MNIISRMARGAALLMLLVLAACSDKASEAVDPAPLGDRSVLESLAESYTRVSDDKLSISPMNLQGEDRKRFVEQVFADAGYSYSATLREMAVKGVDRTNKLHTDLVDLVMMPHRNPKYPTTPAEIYTPQELMDVAAIERMVNQ